MAITAGSIAITQAGTADRSNPRSTADARRASFTETKKHARPSCAKKCQTRAARRNKNKSVKHHQARPKTAQRLRVFSAGKPILKSSGTYRLGVPYKIGGTTYTPRLDPNYRAEGKASWYGGSFHGRRTANGERFDMDSLTAAHPTLPLPSYVRVTNLENQRSIIVRLNDRGPYHGRRLIDVSVRAAKLLGFYDQGLAQVRVEYVGRAELARSTDRNLASKLRHEEPRAVEIARTMP